MKRRINVFFAILFICSLSAIFFSGCQADTQMPQSSLQSSSEKVIYWRAERDYIAMLAAYSVVYKGWQPNNARGYNIGSVLLDKDTPQGKLVFWARNCNNVTENETQHGEVRLMLGYLARLHKERQEGKKVPDIKNLNGYTVYTTLEPCAQCAGMMTLQEVKRTVYGQSDPGFGKAIERLELDSRALPDGYKPYPRPVISERANILYCNQIDEAYEDYRREHGKDAHITDFLKTETARSIFARAYGEFLDYEAKNAINKAFLENARDLVKEVPAFFVPLHPDI